MRLVRLRTGQEFTVASTLECAPGAEAAFFLVELIGEIDVRLAVEQVSKIQAGMLQMDRVDLEITPVEGSI